jgi:two-component sensor histidine kinase
MALSRVAAQLDTTTNLSQVYATLGNELKRVGMNCMVGTLDTTKMTMRIDYLSAIGDIIRLVEKFGNYLPEDLLIPRKLWPTDVAVTEKVPYWDSDPIGSITKMLPFIPKQIIEKAFEMAGISSGYQICYLPMISEEDVIGILAVWGHNLSQEDIPGLSVFVNQVAYAIRNTRLYDQAQKEIFERTQAETRIREALKEKDVLLKEVHHRVKNNLQVISSLLNLQSAQIKDPETVQLFRDSQNRVRSMALIHEKLYQSHDLAKIDFKGYAQSLSNYLVRSFAVESRGVAIRLDVDPIEMGIDQAIPCGLIINELVSNSLKYAFPEERKGEVHIRFSRHGDHQFHLIVGDNGIGFPENVDYQNTSSLGLQLVNSLVKQLDGNVELNRRGGTEFHISFYKAE